MGSVFNIVNLLSEINKRGLLRPSKFLFSMPIPNALRSASGNSLVMQADQGVLSLWCEATSLPGALLVSAPVRNYGYGPIENKPYAATFTDITLTFRADADGMMHEFLHAWMKSAVCYEMRTAPVQIGQNSIAGGGITDQIGPVHAQHPWEVGYKAEYAVDATISVFNDTGIDGNGSGGEDTPSIQIFLREAFPIAILDSQLNWQSQKDYLTIQTVLTFMSWSSFRTPVVGQ